MKFMLYNFSLGKQTSQPLQHHLIKLTLPCCRFTSPKDVKWFEESLVNLAQQDLGPQVTKKIAHTNYFVDFLR